MNESYRKPAVEDAISAESYASPEKELPQTDAVVVLGKGVERVPDGDGMRWRTTRYIQELVSGPEGAATRTGERKPLASDADPSQNKLVVAGGTANTLAAVEYFDEMRERSFAPKVFIISAGRPDYLKDEPEGFSESTVMRELFKKRIPDHPELLQFATNKNTRDDVFQTLATIKERGLKSVAFINTEISFLRMQEFYQDILTTNPEFASIAVHFVMSEDLLRRRYAKHPGRIAEFEAIQEALHESDAWRNSVEMEEGGIRAIREGKYRGRGNY